MAAFNLVVRKIRNEFKIQKIVDVIKGKIDQFFFRSRDDLSALPKSTLPQVLLFFQSVLCVSFFSDILSILKASKYLFNFCFGIVTFHEYHFLFFIISFFIYIYLKCTPSGCKDIGIRKLENYAKWSITLYLNLKIYFFIKVLPGAGHPAYLDAPELWHTLLHNFINNIDIDFTEQILIKVCRRIYFRGILQILRSHYLETGHHYSQLFESVQSRKSKIFGQYFGLN